MSPVRTLAFGSGPVIKDSISAYYGLATGVSVFDARDILVGSLFAMGFFLFAYKGYEPTDDHLGDLAGALGLRPGNKTITPAIERASSARYSRRNRRPQSLPSMRKCR